MPDDSKLENDDPISPALSPTTLTGLSTLKTVVNLRHFQQTHALVLSLENRQQQREEIGRK
jgi:hypothetical protein